MSTPPTLPPSQSVDPGKALSSSVPSLSPFQPRPSSSSSMITSTVYPSSTSTTSPSTVSGGTATATDRPSITKSSSPPSYLSIHTEFTSNAEQQSLNTPAMISGIRRSSSNSGILHSPTKRSPVSTHNSSLRNIPPDTLPSSPSNRSWWRSSTVTNGSGMEEEVRINVRKRVLKAVLTTVINVGNVSHEALALGVEFLDLAPVPGLRTAGQLVLDVWSAVEQVTINRLASLRLAERFADFLLSVRLEVKETGNVVGEELKAPLGRLEESFKQICEFLLKNNQRPLLMRYLKREEILREISNLDRNYSVQIRILKQVLESERQRQLDTHAILRHISAQSQRGGQQQHILSQINQGEEDNTRSLDIDLARIPPAATSIIPVPSLPFLDVQSPQQHSRHEIIRMLQECLSLQNTSDAEKDMQNLHDSMRKLVQSSDLEVVDALGVRRGEIVEAVKTLQRALEREKERGEHDDERNGDVTEDRKARERGKLRNKGTIKKEKRVISMFMGYGGSQTEDEGRYSLEREFMETSIDALRRLSRGVGMDTEDLPGWTITPYEVDRDRRIGKGFFSVVYRGTWRGKIVAMKVLDASAPRDLFKREVEIWKPLKHPHVLELFGASSTAGDPPWYFVSPFLKNGNLVEYLRGIVSLWRCPPPFSTSVPKTVTTDIGVPMEGEVQREWDLWRFMHEIAKGMQYLHSYGVLHGDLKGANVLVDDELCCIISDFGQSEIKMEAYRISGKGNPHGTLRWQAPELMSGNARLAAEIDVYAYAIVCTEVLTMGKMPWLLSDDDAVRQFVLVENTRPAIPASRFYPPKVQNLLRKCWARNPKDRPPFTVIVQELKVIRMSAGVNTEGKVLSPRLSLVREDAHCLPLESSSPISDMEGQYRGPESVPVVYNSSTGSRRSSMFHDMPESPVFIDQRMAMRRDERRYRLLLEHNFHHSLNLPLWSPSPVEVGAVGYLQKPEGNFVTLFNAFTPQAASQPEIRSLPSVYGYGNLNKCNQKIDHRSFSQKGTDKIMGWLTSKKGDLTSQKITRKVTFPLKAGRKIVALYTEHTNYNYVDSLDAPKRWFKSHVDQLTQSFGALHHIQREDLYLVVGSLQTPNYALLVSHRHPDGHAYFNVFSSPKNGQPWGSFTTDSVVRQVMGPKYNDRAEVTRESGIKISKNEGIWDSVLLARLRLKPDDTEPTSL